MSKKVNAFTLLKNTFNRVYVSSIKCVIEISLRGSDRNTSSVSDNKPTAL